MSKAFKCDRCGKFYEMDIISHKNERRYLVTKNVMGEGMIREYDFDLCSDCQDALENFLLKKTLTPDEVCKAIFDYEHDPDTIFLVEKGKFTVADIRNILIKKGEDNE